MGGNLLKKHLVSLLVGVLIGAVAMTAVPAYGAVKQYILTKVNYPIVVDGVAYNDPSRPILNYDGSTYIPLAKLGDLLGVQYEWNAEKQRVEINTGGGVTAATPSAPGASAGGGVAGRKGDVLQPDTEIIEPEIPGYKGYADYDDPSYQWAEMMGSELPPLLSEGWISTGMLDKIEGITVMIDPAVQDKMSLARYKLSGIEVLLRFDLPRNFKDTSTGDFEINEVEIKKHDGDIFFNLEDLRDRGIIKN
jgi:hypothetical protein